MTINTIKDLEAILKLCHRQGVSSIEVDGIKMQITGEQAGKKLEADSTSKDNIKAEGAYSDEDLLFWSSTTPGAE